MFTDKKFGIHEGVPELSPKKLFQYRLIITAFGSERNVSEASRSAESEVRKLASVITAEISANTGVL